MRTDFPGCAVQAQHFQLTADQQLGREHKQQLVQKGVQQRLRVMPLRLKVPAEPIRSTACMG